MHELLLPELSVAVQVTEVVVSTANSEPHAGLKVTVNAPELSLACTTKTDVECEKRIYFLFVWFQAQSQRQQIVVTDVCGAEADNDEGTKVSNH